jgi:hypothetical protein
MLLDTCGEYFDQGTARKRLDKCVLRVLAVPALPLQLPPSHRVLVVLPSLSRAV